MKTKTPFEIGSQVQWNFRGHKMKGTVQKIHLKRIEKELNGKMQVRNGSEEKPAYQVKTTTGNEVLLLHSELKSVRA